MKVRAAVYALTARYRGLRYFGDETIRVEPIQNPFGSKVLPMSPAGMNCDPCVRKGL
jgi:hypothetical protein